MNNGLFMELTAKGAEGTGNRGRGGRRTVPRDLQMGRGAEPSPGGVRPQDETAQPVLG